ncbi:MAG: Gfo/Idh/MocA family oxidoreductase [Rhodospirillales bacterium]|nr:Gfo/Idh/MocA family oxidoreductase [Rhodospirillales bacterium]
MLRAASIGMGWWSDELADAVQGKSDAIRIVTCFTRSEEKRAAFAKRYDTVAHDSYEAVLADETIDAVILTTPHSTHAEQVIAAAAAGKHVFCEKPFTLTRASAQAAVDACAEAGVVLAIGQNRRWHSATRELKYMVERDQLGTILHAEANFSVPSALGYPPELWRSNRVESPAGSVTALGIHMIDALIYLMGPVARVAAQAHRRAVPVDIDDTTSALFRFESGASGYLGTFFACPHTSYINIYGTKGNALGQIDNSKLTLHQADEPARERSIEPNDTLRLELDEFAAACTGEAQYTVTTEEAVHGIAVMEALIEAAASSEWVEVAGGSGA